MLEADDAMGEGEGGGGRGDGFEVKLLTIRS